MNYNQSCLVVTPIDLYSTLAKYRISKTWFLFALPVKTTTMTTTTTVKITTSVTMTTCVDVRPSYSSALEARHETSLETTNIEDEDY